ncbi:MAG: 8-amino-7-oxononanoate synthase [Nitrospira sp.]|nr:8-amino-7-oxononanoate synthase [Nitrospira sp.]
MDDLAAQLADRRAQGLYRQRQIITGAHGVRVQMGQQSLLSFCSNDYLGLASEPRIVNAFCVAATRYGVGSGASHLITGHNHAHHALEEELAEFVGAPRVLLFSTGYMANLGVVTALAKRHGTVFEDKLNHASLIDAARLSNANVQRYPHADVDRLTALVTASDGDKLITTDAVFSMDGDLAPLEDLAALAAQHQAWLLVDDAHGLGVLGPEGRGSLADCGIAIKPPTILMGTLGKAFGVFGAFVAGSHELIETLIQQARTYIYTTALPPAVAEAARASLKIVQTEIWRRQHLFALVEHFVDGARNLGLRLADSQTPIQPVIFGDAKRALAASEYLRDQGILVTAIRPPTVPRDTARLRITFSAAHEIAHVDRLLDALSRLPVTP